MPDKIAVVDASLIIKAILPNSDSSTCQKALLQLSEAQLAAPALWVYEITSTFAEAVHFGQIEEDECEAGPSTRHNIQRPIILPDKLRICWLTSGH